MAGGSAIRGSRVGAGPMGEAERGESAPRRRIPFWCANGHETRSPSPRRPPSRRPGTARAAACRPGSEQNPPPAPRNEPYKTHLAYVRERRTDADGEAILEEALTRLHQRRGGLTALSRASVAAPAAGIGLRVCQLAVRRSQYCAWDGRGPGDVPLRAAVVVRLVSMRAPWRGHCPGPRPGRVRAGTRRAACGSAGRQLGRRGLVEQPAGGPDAVHAGRRHLRRPAPASASATAAAFSSPATSSHTSSARVDRREAEGDPGRRRLRAAAHRDHRPLVVHGRRLREDRRDVALRADAEQQHVEAGAPPWPSGGGRGQLAGVPGGGGLRARRRPRRRRHRVHPCRARRPRSSSASRACFSLRSASPAGRNRSSPHQTSTRRQSTASRPARRPAPHVLRTAMPIPPPVSTTEAEPCTACGRGQPGDQRLGRRPGAGASASGLDDDVRGRAPLTRSLVEPAGVFAAARRACLGRRCRRRCRPVGRVEPDVRARRAAVGQPGDAGRRLERVA